MKPIHPVSLAVLCLALSACGGSEGGGSVASTPAPVPAPAPAASPSPTPSPTPTPPPVTLTSSTTALTPLPNKAGLVAGTYQPIAIAYDRGKGTEATDKLGTQTTRILDPAAIKLTANPSAKSYTLNITLSGFPTQKVLDLTKAINESGQIVDSNLGNHVVRTETYSDGTTKVIQYDALDANMVEPFKDVSGTAATRDSYGINLGPLRYISFGGWEQEDIERVGTAYKSSAFNSTRSIAFVFGRRTTPGELPTTGTATYWGRILPMQAVNFSGDSFYTFDLELTAKFSTKSIDARISADAFVSDDWSPEYTGLSLTGSGAIATDGGYTVALAGKTVPFGGGSGNPLTGSLQGAFFGPGAEETGGVFKIDQGSAALLYGTYGLSRKEP